MGIIDIVPTSGLVFLTRSIVREIINSCERRKMPLFKLIAESVVSESYKYILFDQCQIISAT